MNGRLLEILFSKRHCEPRGDVLRDALAPIGLIPLPDDKFAIVDESLGSMLSQYNWCLNDYGYVFTNPPKRVTKKRIMLHQLVMPEVPRGLVIDHISGDRLDNRRENLRPCLQSRNSCNRGKYGSGLSSQFKGVSLHKATGMWRADITNLGVRTFLGYFRSETEAAKVYDEAALQLHGEFARTNFNKTHP